MNADIDVTQIRIETPRLLLRSWQEQDLEELYEYAGVPGVGEAAGWSHHKSLEESRRILNMFIREKKTFAIVLKTCGKVIGSLGIENADHADGKLLELKGREVGYVLSMEYWGQGLMTEAVQAVIQYCFSALDYDFLTCSHFLQNTRSRRVIEKCGFHLQKEISYETQLGTAERSLQYILYNPKMR